MRLTLSDDVADVLQEVATAEHTTIEKVADALIARTIHVGLQDRFVLLAGEDRERLEALVGRPVKNSGDVVKAIERLGSLFFGHIRIKLTLKHLEEITARAEKRGLTPKQLIAEIASEVEPMFFDSASGFGVSYTPASKAARDAVEVETRGAA